MKVKVLQFDNYIETIKKSVGSNLFQNIWAEVDEEKKDITKGGVISCASFVSGILLLFSEFGLLKMRHAGTAGLLKDMEGSGWFKIDKPRIGAILHWEVALQNGGENEHIGFYVGDEKAVSTDWESCLPSLHHYTYGETDGIPNRKIEGIFWHPRLDDKYFESK